VERDATLALRIFAAPDAGLDAAGRELIAAVGEAHRAHQQALRYFHQVAEPDMVDHAVLQLAAAERRYAYLLGQARRAGVQMPRLDARPRP